MTFGVHCDPHNIFFRCVEDSNEAIMITDVHGQLVYVNPAWTTIYEYTAEEALGKTPRLLHSGHQGREFYERLWAKLKSPGEAFWKGEVVNRAKSGKLIPVLLTITPFKSPTGLEQGYMGIAVDLTAQKELELKVAHQDRLASVGLLAGGLAHEVGTPLGVIRGRAEFLAMESKDPIHKKNLDVIVAQIDRISKLIRSLLRVSRSSTDIRLESVTVVQVFDEVLTLMRPNFSESSIEFSASTDERIKALSDFGRLEQILLNLVTNALHALKKAIADGQPGKRSLKLLAKTKGDRVLIEVNDTGCGISPEIQRKIFIPFFTTKGIGEGTGLGLAIVSQIAHEIGGEISVQSTPGEGTQFTVSLPALPLTP